MIRQAWIDSGNAVSVVQQCTLAGVSRSTVYARSQPKPIAEIDLLLSDLIETYHYARSFFMYG